MPREDEDGAGALPTAAAGSRVRMGGKSHASTTRNGANVIIRPPRVEDAPSVWSLVRDSGALDVNSPYAYLLMCSHFADTSVVAEAAGVVLGFVFAYRPPSGPEAVFVWQVGVDRKARGLGLGTRLLGQVVARSGARFLEATVTTSNQASWALFRGFARHCGVACREKLMFGEEVFPPDGDHEPETLVRIGPFEERAGETEEER